MKRSLTSMVLLLGLLPKFAFATGGDLSLEGNSVHFSASRYIEGKAVRIYATSQNTNNIDLYGVVRFFDTHGRQIGTDQPISVFAGRTDDVFVDWVPKIDETEIKIQLFPFDPKNDDPANNVIIKNVTVEADLDRDGIPDAEDADIDNDGVANEQDKFPKDAKESADTDGDSVGDNADPDIDNDGFLNTDDTFPKDPTEHADFDHDGIGDNADKDNDNDELADTDEQKIGTDMHNPDTDGDGVMDGQDAFPLDPKEQKDTDHDGIGNNADADDDNDGTSDSQDKFPTNLPAILGESHDMIVPPEKDITFDASSSKDPDGKIKKVTWNIDQDPEEDGIIAHHVFHETGVHKITVSVMDDAGEVTSKSFHIYVSQTGRIIIFSLIGIILALAIYFIIKYSTAASDRKRSSKSH